MSNRNDVHSPANLVPENYEYIFAADNNTPWVLRAGDFGLEVSRKLGQSQLDRHCHQCHHCGAHIRYFAVLEYKPTGEYIAVGETCLERFEMTSNEFHALRKAAELDRQKQRIKTAIMDFTCANPDLAFMADSTGETTPEASQENSFIADVARKLRIYGELSERQIDAVRNSLVRDQQFAARKAAEAASPKVLIPVVEGKQTITGEVLTVKWQDSDFGGSLKMLVKDDRGFKVWGTVPRSLDYSARNHETNEFIETKAARGDRVAFSATVEAKAGEVGFGFFKRPTKGVILSKGETT